MTDDLARLAAALKAAAPAPDAAAKDRALRLAMENFDRAQETAARPRPMSDRPQGAGFLTGVRQMLASPMFSRLTSRPALAATASVVAIGVAITLWPAFQRGEVLPGQVALPTPRAAAPTTAPASPAEATYSQGAQPGTDALAKTMAEAVADAATRSARERAEARPEAPADATRPRLAETLPAVSAEPMLDAAGIIAASPPPLARPEADGFAASPLPDSEAYASADPNPVRITADDPVSTFSIDTDTASWPVIRSSLSAGTLPPREAVRIEEMVNYFPYDYPAPEPGTAPFRASVSLSPTPWNPGTQLLRIGLQGALPAVADRPALNLVFLIDTSGSMDDPKKLPLLKQSFRLMLGQLRPEDRLAIVTYAGSAGLVLEPTDAGDRATILAALDRLDAGGSTAGAEGLRQAYQVAESMAGEGRIGRILLATDGDFNVGISDPGALEDFVAARRRTGTYLSVLGFGRGNLDDAVMQALAQNGNGTAAHIDTLAEAQKVLVDQLTGALFPIADDVKVQVEFNPAAVAEYRLIGYETRALARTDFSNDRVDAGEIGAGHQVTALYEITPVGSPARLTDPLRYAAPATPGAPDATGETGFLRLRYKAPGAATSSLIEVAIPAKVTEPDTDARFAAAIAGIGQLLSDPRHLGDWGWDQAIALAQGARGQDPFGYRAEAVGLMRLAQSLAR
ncbi:MAG: VWA domain-containing protein [Alphaproteobacteria bacterium HGW-Alphaproteobacteria-6]|nr:MAG: VWA domain-containing protein [Alphaproteobacteria bacterium HGW-Alphaproteobacteria-6]